MTQWDSLPASDEASGGERSVVELFALGSTAAAGPERPAASAREAQTPAIPPLPRQARITCEMFVERLKAELDSLCADWNETRALDPEECPETMSLHDWWTHLGTRFPG